MRRIWNELQRIGQRTHSQNRPKTKRVLGIESLGSRLVMAADSLPGVTVFADHSNVLDAQVEDQYQVDKAGGETVDDRADDLSAADEKSPGVCHGVTALAWARVDGVSQLNHADLASQPVPETRADDTDVLLGGWGDDWISGGTGQDAIKGGLGRDLLLGGSGQDLESGAGIDVLIGNTGSDRLYGNGGDDLLIGGLTSFDRP